MLLQVDKNAYSRALYNTERGSGFPENSEGVHHAVEPVAIWPAGWPGLPDGALVADYAGIRPKLSGPGQASADFVLWGPKDHGMAGLVGLLGIESPGLTASLAIAEDVAAALPRR